MHDIGNMHFKDEGGDLLNILIFQLRIGIYASCFGPNLSTHNILVKNIGRKGRGHMTFFFNANEHFQTT